MVKLGETGSAGKVFFKNLPVEKLEADLSYAIIREESGTHFDPAVVDAFFTAAISFSGTSELPSAGTP